MRYMLLIYTEETARGKMPPQEAEKIMAGHWAVMDETTKLGIFKGAEPLEPTSTAITIRKRNGKALTIDGPFAETKEQLGGYYILDCKDLDEAIHWASQIPVGCGGGEGCVEIRPIREIPARSTAKDTEYAGAVNG